MQHNDETNKIIGFINFNVLVLLYYLKNNYQLIIKMKIAQKTAFS